MVSALNKMRTTNTTIIVLISFLLTIFTRQDDFPDVIEITGCVFVFICALGRVYCTAYLGGKKSQQIVDYGPFSVCRNPLYAFSFIGVIGVGFITTQLIVMVFLPFSFLFIYIPLILREEEHLINKFGPIYLRYKERTPRFLPNFKLYHAPATVPMLTKSFYGALKDSMMWVFAFPLLELIEYLQDENIIRPLHIHLL